MVKPKHIKDTTGNIYSTQKKPEINSGSSIKNSAQTLCMICLPNNHLLT